MLTASGISNTRASYLDVARTLGAGRAYLIFRVAIPAAMPSIFIGLFMGLGASFLTLVVAETVGVKIRPRLVSAAGRRAGPNTERSTPRSSSWPRSSRRS